VIDTILVVHAWIRWPVLVLGAFGVVEVILGGVRGRRLVWLPVVFVSLLDIQLLLGAGLWILDAVARTDAVRHALVMLVAVAGAHYFRIRAKRLVTAARGFELAGYLFPLLLITLGITVLL
jgi:hypothetical protein